MQITDSWLTRPETQAVCAMLTENGAQALFVGGCVRNAVLGVSVSCAAEVVPSGTVIRV